MFYWKNKLRSFAYVVICGLTACILSCKEEIRGASGYFPVDSLINAQVRFLNTSKAELVKYASLEKTRDSVTYKPADSAAWANELSVLAQLSALNKPSHKGLYLVSNGLKDPRSNLTMLQYEATTDLPVPYLRIYYLGNLSNIRKIEGAYKEENSLYKSAQIISIELQDVYNKNVLTSYSIRGGQKMILADSIDFWIDARINLK